MEGRGMRTGPGLLMRIVNLGFMLMMVISMSAYAGLFGHTKAWKEEVLLHDGHIMVVERSFKLGGYPALEAQERSPLDQTITFILPGKNKKISWVTEYRDDKPEPNSLGALLLDVVDGVPYLATSPAGCVAYNKWGRPNPPYVLFKYVNDKWQQIPLKEFPRELAEANLMGIPASKLLKPYYNVEASRAERNSGNVNAYAKTILREPLPKERINQMCMEMVLYKGAWVGPGDSIGKRMMDKRSK
jgi:hypothetical protein